MSTRSYILMETEQTADTHEYYGIYCHWDGYPENNGRILVNYYKDKEKVRRLIALGDLSSLGPHITPNPEMNHSFDDPQDDVCVAYGRDRGEEGTEPKFVTLDDLMDENSWIEYIYVYTLDNEWVYYDVYEYQQWLRYKKACQENDEAYYESDQPYNLYEYDEKLGADLTDDVDTDAVNMAVVMATNAALDALFGPQDDIRITARLSTEDDVDDDKITK